MLCIYLKCSIFPPPTWTYGYNICINVLLIFHLGLFIMSGVFLLLCMPSDLWSDVNREFDLAGGWIFLHSYNCLWALLWDTVRLFGHSLLGGTREVFSVGLIFPHYWGNTLLERYLKLLDGQGFPLRFWKCEAFPALQALRIVPSVAFMGFFSVLEGSLSRSLGLS